MTVSLCRISICSSVGCKLLSANYTGSNEQVSEGFLTLKFAVLVTHHVISYPKNYMMFIRIFHTSDQLMNYAALMLN